jgi:hypothetical protein
MPPSVRLGCASLALALMIVPACGGDDDDVNIVDGGGGGGSGDDAGAGGGAGVLGQSCNATTPCPDSMPVCLTVGQGATEGFCSKGCATTPAPPEGEDPMLPPQESHDACREGYTGDAVPACAAPLAAMNGIVPWACVLACGDTPDGAFGTCPSNLACEQPDPELNGFCFPPS